MTKNKYKVGETDDIEPGERMITEVDGKQIAVFNTDGTYHALLNYCVHQSGPLCEGPVTGEITIDEELNWRYDEESRLITCPWHYWKFDLATGESTRDSRYKVPTYDVLVEGDELFVALDDTGDVASDEAVNST